MDYAVTNFHVIQPQKQSALIEETYYPRRNAEDSEVDPQLSIANQFGLIKSVTLSVSCVFTLHGHKYKLTLERVKDE